MGKPLKVGMRDQRYPRVTDRKTFSENYDAIYGPREGAPKRAGSETWVWRNGKKILLKRDGKFLAEEPKPRPDSPGADITVYDWLKAQQPVKQPVPIPADLLKEV